MSMDIHPNCYIAPGVVLIGDLVLEKGCSVWPNAVIRADKKPIHIGEDTNIQDCSVIHCTDEKETRIGRGCSLGHGSVVHASTVGDNCIIGINAAVLDGAEIGNNCLIAAGAVVPPGMKVPSDSLVMGVPGKVVKQDNKIEGYCRENADGYNDLRDEYLQDVYPFYRKDNENDFEAISGRESEFNED